MMVGGWRMLTEACGIANVSAGIPYVFISTVNEAHFFGSGHKYCPEISYNNKVVIIIMHYGGGRGVS